MVSSPGTGVFHGGRRGQDQVRFEGSGNWGDCESTERMSQWKKKRVKRWWDGTFSFKERISFGDHDTFVIVSNRYISFGISLVSSQHLTYLKPTLSHPKT